MQLRFLVYLTPAMLLAGAVPAHAAQANGQAATKAEAKSAAGEKKICRRLVQSGSRMTERVCLTKEAWKKVDAETQG